jgi:Flp pilus assembly protein TadG
MIGGALRRLFRDSHGTMAVETALVAPVLALMALGTFDVGRIVSRQQELQSSASEAEGIVLASAASAGTSSDTIKQIIEKSLGLSSDQVSLELRFRCDMSSTLTTDASTCSTDEPIYQYILLDVSDTYTPMWTNFGVGSPLKFNVERTVQVQ